MGTEAFWIPAALTALSAGGQYVNQQNALSRQNTAETQAINNQQQIRGQANQQVKQLTDQIAKSSPQQLQGKATGDFVSQLRQNVGSSPQSSGPTSALAPVVGGSSRYNADVAQSGKDVQDYGNTNASELSAMDSAIRQRQNEGLAMQTLGTNLNGLGAQSYTQNFVDQLRAQAAGQTSPWVSLLSNLAGNAGKSLATNGVPWGTAADSAEATSMYNDFANGQNGVSPFNPNAPVKFNPSLTGPI